MTEGELYKRLFTATSYCSTFGLSDEELIKINDILAQIVRVNKTIQNKILNEVKAEFPTVKKGSFLTERQFTALGLKREEWFSKWFGEF